MTTSHATTIRHAAALCLAGLTALIVVPIHAEDNNAVGVCVRDCENYMGGKNCRNKSVKCHDPDANAVQTAPVTAPAVEEAPSPAASTDQHYTCTITYKAGDPQCGKEACAQPFSGIFADLSAAQKRCREYAANHGGTCDTSTCKLSESVTETKQKFYCSGNVRCEQEKDSSKERFCGYDRNAFEAKDTSDAERKARNKWIPDCRERDSSTKWTCKMHKGPKCDVGEK